MESGGEIWFAATSGEIPRYDGDKSYRFLAQLNSMFAHYLPALVRVATPLAEETKADLVAWALKNGYKEELQHTTSCFAGLSFQGVHCGRCQACLRKWLAFAYNGLELETATPVKIGCREYIKKYRKVLPAALKSANFSHYSKRRCEQDLKALDML
jgi:7-cyano-7-deazaguanine synthase in queuosine biosynthesis